MPSDWIVLKFGGTSVASPARWQTIARLVRERRAAGQRPFVVCSALSGVTDQIEALLDQAARGGDSEALLNELHEQHAALAEALGVDAETWQPPFQTLRRLARGLSLTRHVPPPLRAQALAQGELLSTRIGAAFLQETAGLPTRWLDARTALRARPASPRQPEAARVLSADCDFAPDPALQRRLSPGENGASGGGEPAVVLTQGFIAAPSDASNNDSNSNASDPSETVLIGRGGSDTSAAYFAAKLEAERLEIWTDVPGLFTADPRAIPSARLLRQLGYAEAQEMATTGASVLHPRCLRPVREAGIPLHIRCTPAPEIEGTVISDEAGDLEPLVKTISTKRGVVLISMQTLGMWQQAGFLGDVFGVFKAHGLSVDLVATSESEVTVTLDAPAQALSEDALDALMEDLSAYCEPSRVGPCAQVSLVGRRIRAILHQLGPALGVFEEQQVHLVTQAASDLNLSVVVEEAQAERLARELHAQLFATPPAKASNGGEAPFGPSWEHLRGQPPEPRAERAWWRARRTDLLRVAEEKAPVYVYDEATLRTSVRRLKDIDAVDRFFYAVKANAHPGVLRLFAEAGLGFECVSPGEVRHVCEALPALPPERILFTPNFAPRSEYAFAAERGFYLTLDNLHPLRAWPEVFAGQDLILRLDPGQGRGHHEHVRTAGAQSKFGIAAAHLNEARQRAEEAGAHVVGLHAHVGSGIARAETWAETAAFLAEQADGRFPEARFFNVGGGLGVAEHPEIPPLDLGAVSEALQTFKNARPDAALWMEPGRFLVAHAGVLLARATQTKRKSEGVRYVGLETGMNSLIRPALYGSYHEIRNLTRLDVPDAITADVVGPICESGDVLGRERRLPETQEGDCLLVATTGAYGHVMSSRYNRRAPAGEHLLRADRSEGSGEGGGEGAPAETAAGNAPAQPNRDA